MGPKQRRLDYKEVGVEGDSSPNLDYTNSGASLRMTPSPLSVEDVGRHLRARDVKSYSKNESYDRMTWAYKRSLSTEYNKNNFTHDNRVDVRR
jgi:hypothetical protein